MQASQNIISQEQSESDLHEDIIEMIIDKQSFAMYDVTLDLSIDIKIKKQFAKYQRDFLYLESDKVINKIILENTKGDTSKILAIAKMLLGLMIRRKIAGRTKLDKIPSNNLIALLIQATINMMQKNITKREIALKVTLEKRPVDGKIDIEEVKIIIDQILQNSQLEEIIDQIEGKLIELSKELIDDQDQILNIIPKDILAKILQHKILQYFEEQNQLSSFTTLLKEQEQNQLSSFTAV